NRTLYKLFLPVGYRYADMHYAKQPVGWWLRILYWLGDRLVFYPLRDKFGLINVRMAITAGASLGPDIFRFFRAIGLNLVQVFGTTETTATGTQHQTDDVKFASVGTAHDGVQLKITDEGEICVGGGNIFMGYFKNEEATNKAIRVDEKGMRWFYSGDAGYIDQDGHLIYLDRVKDMIELASGDKFSPQYIEGRFKFSPYVRDAMAIGDPEKEYVSALISIDFDNVGRWAEKRGLAYTTYVDLSQKPEVYDLIYQDVREVNATLPEGGRVRKFVLMHKEFDADEAEMTRTRKLRRGYLKDLYEEVINHIYGDKQSVALRSTVSYQDGRSSVTETLVHIKTMEES
ncbi:MAG: AMP-binding protein, partial [Anaerolineae bacterium]|nr:AMP-binding protein [Anaerolineae bacterium]